MSRKKNEAAIRKAIDAMLEAAGVVIQDNSRLNLHVSLGVAAREKPLRPL